ncbi:uncharacterized protein LOC116848241 [Odontomachus brunneus]|uniref:uncharacterized protein LOC116848241 n=1 Tax=Odontomachus brunneus TaxID=486640 RepID=UPI0013F1DB83|nr:uncharacterized protein LOC116848241 [Odontomachus brunneus]XP_032680022.1 uncharacterized protein LOC116848241 [Odontomachus brunneus]
MSDLDETDTSCGEEQIISDWEVREEWLENILSKYYDEPIRILQFEAKSEHTSEGALSSIISAWVKLMFRQCQSRALLNIIIKQLPKDPFSRFFVTEGQFDLREIQFYTKLMPDLREFNQKQLIHNKSRKFDDEIDFDALKVIVPQCYHTHYIPAGGTDDSPVPPESMLVLYDPRDKNTRSIKFSEGLDRVTTQLALDAIARFHAHTLAMKVVDGQPLPQRYPFLFKRAKATDSYQQLVERGLPQLVHFLESKPGFETILETLLALRPRTRDIISSLLAPEGPMALITHTDFWSNNLIFYQPDQFDKNRHFCYIVDWQMITYSRPTNDVALLILSSVQTETRRKYIDRFLDMYWNKLQYVSSCLGVDIQENLGYTREDFNKDYRKSQLLALLLCIGSVDVALGDPRTEKRLLDVLEDLYKDGVLTDEDIIATNEDIVATNEDIVTTNEDIVATNEADS